MPRFPKDQRSLTSPDRKDLDGLTLCRVAGVAADDVAASYCCDCDRLVGLNGTSVEQHRPGPNPTAGPGPRPVRGCGR